MCLEKDASKVKKEIWLRKIREGFMEEETLAQALKLREFQQAERWTQGKHLPDWPWTQSHAVLGSGFCPDSTTYQLHDLEQEKKAL